MTSQPAPLPPADITASLNLIWVAVETLTELENQDRGLIIAMSQKMIADLAETGELGDMRTYIHFHCDVYDSSEEADAIADDITSRAAEPGQEEETHDQTARRSPDPG